MNISDLKVGDWVICNHADDYTDVTTGKEYVVLAIDSDTFQIRDDVELYWSGSEYDWDIVGKDESEHDHDSIMGNNSAVRKTYPIYSGFVKYFPDAMAMVSHQSFIGNEQHNPGTELHWDRSKSGDEADALMRHLIEGDYKAVAWRAMALLQKEIEGGYRGIDHE